MKVALAQFNATVGDLSGNADRIAQMARDAHAQGARVVVTPELALTGYPPEDLIMRPAFLQACKEALLALALSVADLPDLSLLVGHVEAAHGGDARRSKSFTELRHFNAASLLQGGKVVATYCKRELPNYQVFDEQRYFASGRDVGLSPLVFESDGMRFGVLICEDAWFDEPAELAKAAGAQVLLVLNASPFHLNKAQERETRMCERAAAVGLPLCYAHLVGGQDEVVFDGGSFSVDAAGTVTSRAPAFLSDLHFVHFSGNGQPSGDVVAPLSVEEQAWQALVCGVRDYVEKNGFPGAILGLSGGIDSAVVLAIAVEALGADRVRAVMMPSRFTANISLLDAQDIAKRLGVRYDEIEIEPLFTDFKAALASQFAGKAEDATEENLQARIRGTLLMALSNKSGAIVLTTGNKSEMATGYCTLYGDMAGGFAVIKDVRKTLVYRLASWKNTVGMRLADGSVGAAIPERIITRAPSAELRADQTDQDSLPPYDVLDGIVAGFMEDDMSIQDLITEGFEAGDVERVTRLIKLNEYKRRQSPVGTRITHRAFGRDWRYPITSKFRA